MIIGNFKIPLHFQKKNFQHSFTLLWSKCIVGILLLLFVVFLTLFLKTRTAEKKTHPYLQTSLIKLRGQIRKNPRDTLLQEQYTTLKRGYVSSFLVLNKRKQILTISLIVISCSTVVILKFLFTYYRKYNPPSTCPTISQKSINVTRWSVIAFAIVCFILSFYLKLFVH